MADDLTIRFGSDTSQLNSGIAQARQTLAQFSANTSQSKSALDALTASMRQTKQANDDASVSFLKLTGAIVAANLATDAIKSAASAYANYAEWAGQATYATAKFIVGLEEAPIIAETHAIEALDRVLLDYAGSAASAASQAIGLTTAANAVRAAFDQVVTTTQTNITALRLYTTETAKIELAAISAAGGLKAFVDESKQSDVSLTGALVNFTAQLEQIPDMSDEAAQSIEAMLGSVPNYSQQANGFLIEFIASISKSGEEALANTKKLVAAFKDAENGGAALADIFSNTSSLDNIKTAAVTIGHMLDPTQASKFYSTMISNIQTVANAQKAANDAEAVHLQNRSYLDAALHLNAQSALDLEVKKNDELQRAIDLLQGQKAVYDQINAVADRKATFDTTLEKANPIDSQIEDVEKKIAILQGEVTRSVPSPNRTAIGPTLSPEDVKTLVRTVAGEASGDHEQQLAVAAVAINRLVNGNYGDSLTALLKARDGSEFNTWKPLDKGGSATNQANAPLSTDSYRYKEVLYDIVQPLLDKKVADPTGGALNFYNPTLTPPKNRFPMDSSRLIGTGDTAQLFGTAKNSPAPVEPLDADGIAKAQQALDDLRAKLKTLNDQKAGGNALDQAALEIAQRHATGLQNAVAEQQKLVDGAKAEVDASANLSPEKQNAAAKKLADEQASLREKTVEADIAASKVTAAGFEKDSFDQVAVLNRALNEKLGLYEQNSAAYSGILNEMAANTKRATDKQAADAKKANDAQTADAIAAAKLQAEAYSKGSIEQAVVLNTALARKLAGEKAGSAEYNNTLTEMVSNTKRAVEQEKADQAEVENAKFANAKRSLDDQLSALTTAASEKEINGVQELEQRKAILDQIAALERTHQTNLQGIWGSGTKEYRNAAQQLAEIDAQRRSQGQKAEEDFQRGVVQSYTQSMESVASTVASSIQAITERTGTLRQLFQNVAKNIEGQILNATLKMAADFLASQTKTVAITVATEAQRTAAVLAGNEAREASTVSAALASAAANAAAFAKMIEMSAVATFAGVTAFLAPLMGPAAVGPAAGTEAAVAAVATGFYAQGAWSLPSDQLAVVHAGEMIVPAGQTPWAQSLMAAAANSGSSGGGGDTHNYYNNIYPQRHHSENDIADIVVRKQRQIARGIAAKRK